MTNERNLLYQSLPPAETGWAEFEANFLGKKAGCPLSADLIELAQGLVPPDRAQGLHDHFAACDFCKGWFEAYRTGWEAPPGADDVPAGSLLATFCAEPQPRPQAPPSPTGLPPFMGGSSYGGDSKNVVLTGFHTMLQAGRTQQALQLLRPYLPEVLEAVGLDPALAERLGDFLGQRLGRGTPPPAFFLDGLRAFAREALDLTDLPCRPGAGDWEPVLTRCALRAVQLSPEEPEKVRRFLQEALEYGVDSATGLDHFWASSENARAGISASECRHLLRRIRLEEKRVSPLFGPN